MDDFTTPNPLEETPVEETPAEETTVEETPVEEVSEVTENYSAPVEDYSAPAGGSAPAAAPKSKMVAGLLGIFLGGWGIHRFYLGYTKIAIIQIVVTLVTCGAGALWGLVEGIMILCGSNITTDVDGNPLEG